MLLTRAPLSPKTSFDLHVLGMPPAFVLSQNQTLKLNSLMTEVFREKTKSNPVHKLTCFVLHLRNLKECTHNGVS